MIYSDKQIYAITVVLFILIVTSRVVNAQDIKTNWELSKNKNGIKVYLRKHKETGLKEAKGLMEVHTSLSAILTLLKDVDNQKNWMYANKLSKLLKSDNNFAWILYTVSQTPWPLSDRDLISEARMYQDSSCNIHIKIHALPNYIATNSDYVRINYMHSEWLFSPKANGIVQIQFKIMINIGGSLPIWVMNLAVDKGPYNTLLKMRENLKIGKYQNANLSYINNCR